MRKLFPPCHQARVRPKSSKKKPYVSPPVSDANLPAPARCQCFRGKVIHAVFHVSRRQEPAADAAARWNPSFLLPIARVS
ncbi:hypothetical protein [uncultured Dialister sp.]|uniref:hypothetical protein n=1 Tax=uncultured Dialister sp. TaxID=278064 RepID=UPI00265D9BE9|nr:hypothetical protein [uncultured Dialister sp.]